MDIFWTFYLNHLSPLWGYFFAVVKSFEYNIAISANFVQTVKNSSAEHFLSDLKAWVNMACLFAMVIWE